MRMHVCVWACVHRVMLMGGRVCVLYKEGVGFGRKCVRVCVFMGRGVWMEGVETDSKIPFALVSVGLDQV